jgi:hypothetical protein
MMRGRLASIQVGAQDWDPIHQTRMSALGSRAAVPMRRRYGRCTPDSCLSLQLHISPALGSTPGHQGRETTPRVRLAHATAASLHWTGSNARARPACQAQPRERPRPTDFAFLQRIAPNLPLSGRRSTTLSAFPLPGAGRRSRPARKDSAWGGRIVRMRPGRTPRSSFPVTVSVARCELLS